jgi:hypothetical protein
MKREKPVMLERKVHQWCTFILEIC